MKTIHPKHDVWYEPRGKRIHIAVPGTNGGHWSVKEHDEKRPYNDRMFRVYRDVLIEAGKWPGEENA
jgi:hypothetical protein